MKTRSNSLPNTCKFSDRNFLRLIYFVYQVIQIHQMHKSICKSKLFFCPCPFSVKIPNLGTQHSNTSLTIQQGYPRGVSSVGNPCPTSTWISSVSIYRVYLGEWPIKSLLIGQVHVHADVDRGYPC